LAALEEQAPAAEPLLTGDDVMALLGIPPGPRVGEALRLVAEARAVGDVASREDAERLLRRYAAAQGWVEAPGCGGVSPAAGPRPWRRGRPSRGPPRPPPRPCCRPSRRPCPAPAPACRW